MSDLISRQAAIDAVKGEIEINGYSHVVDVLEQLPSAQPETHEKRTETHACDLISRKDAIRIVDSIDTWQAGWRGNAIESLKAMPSTQPERTGRWILVNDNNGQHFVCEFCGEWKYHQKQKFCGECGARMVKVEHD